MSFNAVAANYAAVAEASYADTLAAAKTMRQAVDALTSSPSADKLQAARKAWLAARELYGQTKAFRFYGGPIDDANGPEGRINAWPMDESFLKQSCFSDNTHRAVVNNAPGIRNVWLGEYKRADGSVVKGASLRELVAAKDAPLAAQATNQIGSSVTAAEAIQAPLDREIVGAKDAAGRLRIQATIDSLTQQSKDLAGATKAAGIIRLAFDAPKK